MENYDCVSVTVEANLCRSKKEEETTFNFKIY